MTHRVSASICLAASFPLGGISGPSYRIAATSGLSLGSPGTTAGPESPPVSNAARESTRNPALALLDP